MNLIDIILFFIWISISAIIFYISLTSIEITIYILHKFHTALHVNENKKIYFKHIKLSIIFGLITSPIITCLICGKYTSEYPIPKILREFLINNSIMTISHIVVILFSILIIGITWFNLYNIIGKEHKKNQKIE